MLGWRKVFFFWAFVLEYVLKLKLAGIDFFCCRIFYKITKQNNTPHPQKQTNKPTPQKKQQVKRPKENQQE